jgi:hypothetical protein
MKIQPLNRHQGRQPSPEGYRVLEKYLPPKQVAEIIPFRRKGQPSKDEARQARIRYLRSIYLDRSQPFEERMKASVWAASIGDKWGT